MGRKKTPSLNFGQGPYQINIGQGARCEREGVFIFGHEGWKKVP